MNTIKQILEAVNDEKEEWFKKRTKHHIDLVKKYCRRIYEYDAKRFPKIIKQSEVHDASKYSKREREPYVHISWFYKLKRDGKKYEVSPELNKEMYDASGHHVKSNPHHPEFHSEQQNVLNKDIKDRNHPTGTLIDSTKMDSDNIAEMCCDWAAVSEEVGDTPKVWADKNVNHRWKFTPQQVKLIYELIDAIWK